MDSTLNQILEAANNTQEMIFDNSITIDTCIDSIQKISSYVTHLKSVTERIKNIHNVCLKRINGKICNMNPINKNIIGTKKWHNNILEKKDASDDQMHLTGHKLNDNF